jgi:hypothetical protein
MDIDDDEDIEDALGLIATTNLIYERRHAVRVEGDQRRRRHRSGAGSASPTSGRCP